jgi:hypothetical protein
MLSWKCPGHVLDMSVSFPHVLQFWGHGQCPRTWKLECRAVTCLEGMSPLQVTHKKCARSDKVFGCAYTANTCSRYQAREEHQQQQPTNDTNDHRTSTSNTATDHEVASLGSLGSPPFYYLQKCAPPYRLHERDQYRVEESVSG